jgi:hypothetical protein
LERSGDKLSARLCVELHVSHSDNSGFGIIEFLNFYILEIQDLLHAFLCVNQPDSVFVSLEENKNDASSYFKNFGLCSKSSRWLQVRGKTNFLSCYFYLLLNIKIYSQVTLSRDE